MTSIPVSCRKCVHVGGPTIYDGSINCVRFRMVLISARSKNSKAEPVVEEMLQDRAARCEAYVSSGRALLGA